jgi:Ankyrin repeats (3 copies)/Sulfotransferase domain
MCRCAHDRFLFGKAGWGRLSIGMYVLYLEKWLEHFPPSQFLVVRLEDYDSQPKAYMERIFTFLSVEVHDLGQEDWDNVLNFKHANAYRGSREPILEATETLLRAFHAPYNAMLAALVGDEGFNWDQLPGESLRATQIEKAKGQLAVEKSKEQTEETVGILKRKAQAVRAAKRAKRTLAGDTHQGEKDKNMDQHGVHKHFVESDEGAAQPSDEGTVRTPPNSLRGDAASSKRRAASKDANAIAKNRTIAFVPQRFSIEGLSYPADSTFNEWLRNADIIDADKILEEKDAGRQLCTAAFAMDLGALKYLLWDTGVPPNSIDKGDAERNAFHCLCMIHTMADAHSKSQVFAFLKGKTTWLTPYLQPELPLMSHSVLARDILNSLSEAAEKASQWLIRAGVDPRVSDIAGYTPLHHASVGGMKSLVKVLLEAGVDVDAVNKEGRSALHYAAAYGHAEVAGMLLDAGADAEVEDINGTTANEIMKNPGPMSPADAKQYLGIDQRHPRKIERKIHPEMLVNGEIGGWSAGSGGWGNRRLEGYEEDMGCDVDQYWAHEITEQEVYQNYLARGAPVLIRGLIEDWPVVEQYTPRTLRKNFGHLDVQVHACPSCIYCL